MAAYIRARSSSSQAVRDSLFAAEDTAAPPAGSRIMVHGIDRAGRIWVTGSIPGATPNPTDTRTMLEIIDPASRSKVLSVPMDQLYTRLQGTDLFLTRGFDTDGVMRFGIWRLRIEGLKARSDIGDIAKARS